MAEAGAPPPVRLQTPRLPLLDGYEDALTRGWSPNTTADVAARELAALRTDRSVFLARMNAQKGPHELPDGRVVEKLPSRVFFVSDGEFCGRINLRYQPGTTELPPHVSGHVGYTIVPWKQGRGYATAALRLLLDEAREVRLPFVVITCDEDNRASRRVIEKCGGAFVAARRDEFLKDVTKLVFRVEL